MICDKAVMSRPQVAPPTPPPPHVPSTCVENGSTVSSSQRTFISPHLCGLRRDDLGRQPSQPSCHLKKRGGGQDGEKREGGKGGGEEGCLILLLSFKASQQLSDMFLLGM